MKNLYALIVALFVVNGAMAQWYQQDSVVTTGFLHSVFFTDVNIGYALGDGDTYILKTYDGGTNWYSPSPNSQIGGLSLFFVNSDTGYVVCDGVQKTTDGGVNWTGQSTPFTGYTNTFFTNADTGYVVGCVGYAPVNIGSIEKTTNGGATWIHQWGSNITLWSVFCTDANTVYAVGNSGIILKTSDGGLNWITQTSGTIQGLYSVFFPAEDTGYIVGNEIVLKTTNGGQDWVVLPIGIGKHLSSVSFTDINTGYAVGSKINGSYCIIKTNDGGSSWYEESIDGKGNYVCESVFFPAKDTGYIVGLYSIFKTENGGGFPVGIGYQHKNENILIIYPNPTSTTITIKNLSEGTLSILSISGLELLQQEIDELQVIIDVRTLPSGMYIAKVIGEKGVQVGRFVKQ